MEPGDLLSEIPSYKLYSSKLVRVGTFIGGPLAAGYFIAENYKKLGLNNNVKKTWLITILFTIALFSLTSLGPGSSVFPNYVIPILYSAVAAFLAEKQQGNSIKQHISNSGTMYSMWRGVLIGLISLVITVAIIFLIALVLDKDQIF